LSGATSIQCGTESIIISAHGGSIILSAQPAESMISARTESIILSAGGAKQQSTKSCNGKCGDNGGGRGKMVTVVMMTALRVSCS
jgi:hypothetical protein